MKIKLKKILPLVLSVLIVLSSITILSCLAVTNSETNLILQRLPIIFGSANVDSFELNDAKVRFASSGSANMEKGYSDADTTTKKFWAEKLISITDGDNDNGQYLRPQNSGDDDRVILIYRFLESSVSKISLEIDDTTRKNVSIYLSQDFNTLFSKVADYEIVRDRSKTFTNSFDVPVSCSYMAVVFESPDYVISEIELMGTVNENDGSIISNLTPTMYASAKDGEFTYNWFQIHYGNGASEMKHGYTESDNTSAKTFWDDYTKNLTDDSKETALYIKPENKTGNDRVILVYALPEMYNIKGFSMSFGEGSKNFSVYFSKNRNDLFSSASNSTVFGFFDQTYSDKVEDSLYRYIGIVFEKPDYEINDIAIYGTKFEAPQKGENILKDAIPYFYASVGSSSFDFDWSQTYYTPTEQKHGYTPSDGQDRYPFWAEHLAKLTDQNTETELYIKPEKSNGRVLIAYSFDDYIVNGFSLKTQSSDRKRIQVYASSTKSDLYQNLILEADTYDKDIVDDGTLQIRAKYVAIVLISPEYSVSEIELNADPYQRPDYGTNLIEGKTPHNLFLANRTYPLIPNGDQLIDVALVNKTLNNATDNDFSTSVEWKPNKAKDKVNKDTRYLVLAYDLGDMATVDKVLFDSGLGGLDIFVADDYSSLFETFDNRVYSSDGDKLKADGSDLDPSTNLTPGELLIEIGGAKGRYIGFVITRAQAVGVKSYEIVSINEVQVFGTTEETNYGEDLISGETPIMCYRAKHGEYATSLGAMTSTDDMARYTDNDVDTGAEISFPQVSGMVDYKHGALVMIYYLKGASDIKYFNVRTKYWYGIGGVDVYAANAFSDLFNEESCAFSTGGSNATDEVYDLEYNLGAVNISGYFDTPAKGRYVAFVFTRVCDSNVAGYAYLRLLELEVMGNRPIGETLPNTTLTDSKTGSTATFEYDNPDDKFVFAEKGIADFKIRQIDEKDYSTDTFKYALARNGYDVINKAFVFEFYDNRGKLLDNDSLSNEKVSIKLNIGNESLCFLSEIRNDVPYLIKSAIRNGNFIDMTIEEFESKYILLKYGNTSQSIENLSDGSIISDDMFAEDTEDDSNGDNFIPNDDNVQIYNSENVNQAEKEESKNKSDKKWVVVQTEDPLQWFWDIYDTFAANIWMLIMCIISVLLLAVSIVFGIIFYRKRRI